MFNKTMIRPGDFIILMPVGIPITLQYNSYGNLEKVYTSNGNERNDVTEKLMNTMVSSHTVPLHIHILKGTSWVFGILYTADVQNCSGRLPESAINKLIDKYIESPECFNFFAGTFESTVTLFKGASPIRQNLGMDGFNLLPGWIAPAIINESTILNWSESQQYPFISDLVVGLIIFHKDEIYINYTNMFQFMVKYKIKFVDENGYIKLKIADDSLSMVIDISDAAKFKVDIGSVVVFNHTNSLIYAKNQTLKKFNTYENTMMCDYCGKQIVIPNSGTVSCSDPHCMSYMYTKLKQFLYILKLPEISYEQVVCWISKKYITCIPDIFTLDEYKHIKVHTTIAQIIRALVPVTLIPQSDIFTMFANVCSNNLKTIYYYINHPDLIKTDFSIVHPKLPVFIEWLSDGYNVSDLCTIIESSQIIIDTTNKKFEGAPIFRNKTICITGDFIRGSFSEIAAILQSYSANIIPSIIGNVDCVIIGGSNENINGSVINQAKSLNIPIFEENQFFDYYEIDKDMHENFIK